MREGGRGGGWVGGGVCDPYRYHMDIVKSRVWRVGRPATRLARQKL